jgi:putative membrane protein
MLGNHGTMQKVKLVILLVLAALAIVLVLQNTQSVDTRLFFVTVTMPRAALLMLTLLMGFICGILAVIAVRQKRKNVP